MTPRRTHHHGNLRAELVERALQTVRADGVAGFSLREVGSAAGVTPAAAYRHFESRAALLDEVVVEGFAMLARAMEIRVEEAGEGGALMATGECYLDFALDEPHLFALMFGPDGVEGRRRAGDVARGSPSASAQVRRALSVRGSEADSGFLVAWGLAHGIAALAAAGSITRDDARRSLTVFAEMEAQLDGSQHSACRWPAS